MSHEPTLDLDQALCFALYAASRAMTQAYRPLLDKMGLTYPQFLVLVVLWEKDCRNLKELGEKLYLDTGTLTPLLKRLESAKLVTRVRSKEDEREVYVTLSSKGKELKRQAAKIPEAMLCKINLPLAKVARTRDAVREVLQALHVSTG